MSETAQLGNDDFKEMRNRATQSYPDIRRGARDEIDTESAFRDKPKIAIIIAFQRFRDEEFFVPYELFIKEKYQITVFSSKKGTATGKLGKTFQVDQTIDELAVSNFDAIVFVGGPGGYDYIGNETIINIIKETVAQNKYLTAICMAPLLLAQSGVMQGKKSTVFYDEKDNIVKYGALYTGKPVEIDGKIITADGPSSAQAFAETIISKLNGT